MGIVHTIIVIEIIIICRGTKLLSSYDKFPGPFCLANGEQVVMELRTNVYYILGLEQLLPITIKNFASIYNEISKLSHFNLQGKG